MRISQKLFFWIGFVIVCLQGLSCANIVPPTGGEADYTPPKLLSMSPKDSLLNQKVTKIELHFNKFVEVNNLSQNLTMSPLLSIPPTVIAKGKRIEIKIVDSLLQPNTTYHINLGKAITDNREKTPFEGFSYTFSTGTYFDSLKLEGQVIDAYTGLPDTGVAVQLYPVNFNDSTLSYKKPTYVTKTDGAGKFSFKSLPNNLFKIRAIADLDNNNLWNASSEKIGFIDTILQPYLPNDSIVKPIELKTSLPVQRLSERERLERDSLDRIASKFVGRKKNFDKNAFAYTVEVDTISKTKGTFDIAKNLSIKLNTVLGKLDTAKVFLSYQIKGVEAEAEKQILHDTLTLFLKHNWKPETLYTLRLVKGWAKDTAGVELPPGKYIFKTKSEEEYSKLLVRFSDSLVNSNYHVLILQDKDTLVNKSLKENKISLTLLKPGKCKVILIQDANKNGRWDAGDILEKRQPEIVFPHESEVMLKAGWEHEIDFKYVQPTFDKANKSMRMNRSIGDGKTPMR